MEKDSAVQELISEYSKFSWYDSVGLDRYNRYVVYVNLINKEVMETVRDSLNGKQVLIAYAHSKPNALKNKYITSYDFSNYRCFDQEEPDLDFLSCELDRLEKFCDNNILCEVFFEVHDRKNAVTNLSKKFPEVRKTMEKLYDIYGFDILYDELEV